MKNKKRIVSLITAAAMLIGMMSVSVSADDGNKYLDYIDLSSYINNASIGTDGIGRIGDTVGNNWLVGKAESNNFGGLNADDLPSDGILTMNEYYADTSNKKAVKLGTAMPFKLYTDGYSGGKNDSFKVSTSTTIPLTGKNVKSVNILIGSNNWEVITVRLNYKSGLTENVTSWVDNYPSVPYQIGNGMSRYDKTTYGLCDFSGTKWLEKGANNVLVQRPAGTSGLLQIKIPGKEDERLNSVTLMSSTSQVYGITLENASDDVLKSCLADLWESNKDLLVPSNNEAIDMMLSYIDDCTDRNIDISDIVSDEEISYLRKLIIKVSENTYRNSESEIVSEISFNQEIETEEIEKYITIEKNGEEITDYKIEKEDKSAKLSLPCTREGGDLYEITISKNLSLKDDNSITLYNDYTYSYVLPSYFTAERNTSGVTVKNNSRTEQKWYAYLENNGDFFEISGSLAGGESTVINCGIDDKFMLWDGKLRALIKQNLQVSLKKSQSEKLNAEIDILNNIFIIEGKETTSDSEVNLLLKKDDTVIYAGSLLTDSEGGFRFEAPLSDEKIEESGYISISVSTEKDLYEPDAIYYATEEDKKNIINFIKNTTDIAEMTEKLEEIKLILNLDFEPIRVIDSESYAKRLIKSAGKLDNTNTGTAQKILKQQAVLEAVKESADCVWINGYFNYENIMNYSDIDKDGVTIYSIYSKGTNDIGKKAVYDAVSGKDYEQVENYIAELKLAMFEKALNNPSTGGLGYIRELLTKENSAAVNANITKYLDSTSKDAMDKDIAKANINTVSDLEKFINSWKPAAETPSGGSPSGNKGNTGSGGTKAYPVGIVPNDVVTENLENKKNDNTEKSIFSDMPETHWAYKEVKQLYEKGVISGKDNGQFCPDDTVTRAEIVKMICAAKGMELSDKDSVFNDVGNDDWCKKYVMTAYENKLINGTENGKFGKADAVTRQDLCVMLYRLSRLEETSESDFTDASDISDYAKGAVSALSRKGILNGFTDGSFRPKDSCTRAQAAVIILKYFDNERIGE